MYSADLPLEHFPNLSGVAKCVQDGFFLRKKPLYGINSVYSNSGNAIARSKERRASFDGYYACALKINRIICGAASGDRTLIIS